VFLTGVGLNVGDKAARVNQPDVGWMLDIETLSPTRHDASEAGLRGGGRPLSVNGVPVGAAVIGERYLAGTRTSLGEFNTLRFASPRGDVREVTLEVRTWTWEDVVFTEGATTLIGLLFFVVGIGTFIFRPFEAASWALLALCTVAGSMLVISLIPLYGVGRLNFTVAYFFLLLAALPATTAHAGLAFPVLHGSLLPPARVLWPLYATQPVLALIYTSGWLSNWQGIWSQSRLIGSAAWLAAVVLFVGRSLHMSILGEDRLVKQRARILLGGTLAGCAPVTVAYFLQSIFGALPLDSRFLQWPLVLFLIALARVTLRYEILNARIAVRRAVMYLSAVAILTGVAIMLSTVRSYAVAVLLFPLLYLWPRFDARLNSRLYPNRERFPEIIREIGNEMAAGVTEVAVLRTLADAPRRLCEAVGGVAFLLPSAATRACLAATDPAHEQRIGDLSSEPLVRLMATLRMEVSRSQIAVEAQYANIHEACLACFERLRAELLLPIERNGQVMGGLAVGPRASGDAYEQAEVDALSVLVQQASQSLIRIAATERLRSRELEFNELKRFFPPQVIDQVMAQGGASELRSQRKYVTVVFVDLRGFTSFSDSVEPEEVMATLAEYHSVMGARIAEFAGTLERFAGDGFMVFFNDPVEQTDHVQRAAAMALAMLRDVDRLRESWQEKGYRIDVGVGIHTGFATCGFIGYEGRRDYGVIGNVTNLAARLSDAAGPGEILISARVRTELGSAIGAEACGDLALKGFHQPQAVFRLGLS